MPAGCCSSSRCPLRQRPLPSGAFSAGWQQLAFGGIGNLSALDAHAVYRAPIKILLHHLRPAALPSTCSISSEITALSLGDAPLGSGPLAASLSSRPTADSEQPSPSLPSICEGSPGLGVGASPGVGPAVGMSEAVPAAAGFLGHSMQGMQGAASVAGGSSSSLASLGGAAAAGRPGGGGGVAGGGTLEVLRRVPGNTACCDCGAADPDWASLNLGERRWAIQGLALTAANSVLLGAGLPQAACNTLPHPLRWCGGCWRYQSEPCESLRTYPPVAGVLMCIECSGVHRRLGVQYSKVGPWHGVCTAFCGCAAATLLLAFHAGMKAAHSSTRAAQPGLQCTARAGCISLPPMPPPACLTLSTQTEPPLPPNDARKHSRSVLHASHACRCVPAPWTPGSGSPPCWASSRS